MLAADARSVVDEVIPEVACEGGPVMVCGVVSQLRNEQAAQSQESPNA